jgi:glycerophosphoryl diester phosphodiesterase
MATPLRCSLAASAVLVVLFGAVLSRVPLHAAGPKQAIGHRGASGYAPEHTLASYRLAIAQKADFVEPDLAVTKDGILICLHDDTLERTTNIAEIFPDRPSANVQTRAPGKHWLANDFTLEEIKRLDAGKWYKPEFAGEKVVAFQEMIDLVRGKAGLYPELKSPALYRSRGVDVEQIFVGVIKKNGLENPESLTTTPIVIQSFDEESIRRVAVDLPTIPRVFLTQSEADITEARLAELATFATGIAPEKRVIAQHPDMVARAHAAGLTVTSWTFSASEKTSFASVRDEMAHYLYDLGIDALFTNNPDQFPRRP